MSISICSITSSCQKKNDEINAYKSEYIMFKPIVYNKITTIETNLVDSITIMVDKLEGEMHYHSCMYCLAEGVVEIPKFFKQHHETLLLVCDRYFRGYDSRLKFAFQTLFKEFYPDEYDQLLQESNTVKAVEWRDIDKEYQLPIKSLFNKYIEIEFNTD
jgi:hypothetical protein